MKWAIADLTHSPVISKWLTKPACRRVMKMNPNGLHRQAGKIPV
jgi:hypothetical protein